MGPLLHGRPAFQELLAPVSRRGNVLPQPEGLAGAVRPSQGGGARRARRARVHDREGGRRGAGRAARDGPERHLGEPRSKRGGAGGTDKQSHSTEARLTSRWSMAKGPLESSLDEWCLRGAPDARWCFKFQTLSCTLSDAF